MKPQPLTPSDVACNTFHPGKEQLPQCSNDRAPGLSSPSMVRLVTLKDDGREEEAPDVGINADPPDHYDTRLNPNFQLRFAAALSCYPIVCNIARYVDINTLHELSRTCHQFRAILLEHRKLLIAQTLRCHNETANPATQLGDVLRASRTLWHPNARAGEKFVLTPGGKVGACARDMVGECRRCGEVVCRNCVIKQPAANVLNQRLRRLCRVCMKSSLRPHTQVQRPLDGEEDVRTFVRSPCTCEEFLWICRPCGQTLRTTDTVYLRGWVWRTRYSNCGGIGAGLGEGNEGVECGRGGHCLDARVVEKEIECDAEELAAIEAEMEKCHVDGRTWAGNSYTTVEVVGIGGQVKRKVKKNVMVGAIVKEYEDERMTSKFLGREQDHVNRSWCSWCDRVVLGKRDLELPAMSSDSIASSSSGDSS